MKRKGIIFLIIVALLCQSGFAGREYPENKPLSDKQEIFYRMEVEESMRIKEIDGMAYYPTEGVVYLRETGRMIVEKQNDIVFTRDGFRLEQKPIFFKMAML